MSHILIRDVSPTSSLDGAVAHYVVYILPGNPGLISFYAPFASALATRLEETAVRENVSLRICGRSLKGFETGPLAEKPGNSHGPAGLAETIEAAEADLCDLACAHLSGTKARPRVILVGHSVGAYIAMELLRRHDADTSDRVIDIAGSILVFPTITHIAKSRNGVLFTPILTLRYFAAVIGFLARILFFMIPSALLYPFVRLATRFPSGASRTVVDFLKSKHGIRQALWLGGDEMRIIVQDKWAPDVWQGSQPGSRPVYMYFGNHDTWVPDNARDELIRAHGNSASGKALAAVDTGNTPHAWCIDHGDVIAEEIRPWIEDILSSEQK